MGRGNEEGWCILRTSGPKTLVLARGLVAAGHAAWTPSRPARRIINRGKRSEKRLDITVPVLPTVVFAREGSRDELVRLSMAAIKAVPDFSLFRVANRIPIIGDASIAGLRGEEERLAMLDRALREAETREEAEAIRIAALRAESEARTAARRAEQEARKAQRDAARQARLELNRSAFRHAPGSEVMVRELPAFTGAVGIVETNDGSSAWVRFGKLSWKIDAWRIMPAGVQSGNTLIARDAA